MSNQTITLTPALYRYLLDVSLREPEILQRLRAYTAGIPHSSMQIAPEQGQLMAIAYCSDRNCKLTRSTV